MEQKKNFNDKKLILKESQGKKFWRKPGSDEIIQAQGTFDGPIRKLGDIVISNGRFITEGLKGKITAFYEDSCYIFVTWDNGTVSSMKDKDLVYPGKEEMFLFRKQWKESLNVAYNIALEKNKNEFAERIKKFMEIKENEDMDREELEYLVKGCLQLIRENKN